MSETTDVQEIEQASTALIVKADSYQITTNEIYIAAMEFAKAIKAMLRQVDGAFDPVIKGNHAAWKAALGQKAKYAEPLESALKSLDNKGRAFRAEQERLRREEEEKARALAQKEADRLARLAERAAEQGRVEKAEEYQAKAAAAALIQPVIAREVPKIAGIKTRTVWKYRIVDAAQIPREYMIPNEVMLGNVARSTKGAVKVAGVEFYSEDSSI